MKTYLVCDQDGYISYTEEGDDSHFLINPTHTSHIGVCGDSGAPIPYTSGGSSTIPEVTTDPVSPTINQAWVLDIGSVGVAGQAMGVLGLTYSRTEVDQYQLSIKMANGDIKRTNLNG